MNEYKAGFTIHGKHPCETEEWLYAEEHSNDKKLVFFGYDANLCALPYLGKRLPCPSYSKLRNRALEFTEKFKGEVWLDDVRIK